MSKKKLFLKNVFFLVSRMECCSTFFKAYFFTRAGAGAGQKKIRAGTGQKWIGSAKLPVAIQS